MSQPRRTLERVLIVEDNVSLRGALAGLVRSWGVVALEAGSAPEALAHLGPAPDLLICDVRLADGSVFSILEAMSSLSPQPAKVAISGAATPQEAFQLAQAGVLEFLSKPFTLDEFSGAVFRALSEAPGFDPQVRASVGRIPMREIQRRVRNVMVEEALALSHGNLSGAARLLDVSRQAVQQIVRTVDDGGDSNGVDSSASAKLNSSLYVPSRSHRGR